MPGVRITAAPLVVGGSLSAPMRISNASMVAAVDFNQPGRITGAYLLVAGDALNTIIIPELLDSDNEIFGLDFSVEISPLTPPEHNPYRPAIPEELASLSPEFYNHAQENQEHLRKQHEITQAGDTTLPYELLTQAHDGQKFTLGSVSRFFHADYGMIHARYVQFSDMAPAPYAQCPVGFVKDADRLKWVVTNQPNRSHPGLVVGLSAPYVMPKDESFGWVIVSGPNLQQVGVDDSEPATVGQSYAWSTIGRLSTQAAGRVFARRVAGESIIPEPGQLFVEVESFSLKSIEDFIKETTKELQESIEKLLEDVEVLKDASDIDEFVKKTNAAIALLKKALYTEQSARSSGLRAVNERISNLKFVTASQLATQVTSLSETIAGLGTALSARIKILEDREQPNFAGQIASLESSLALIGQQILALASRPKGKFPLVTGDVPPQLVYLDDGTLVFEETY